MRTITISNISVVVNKLIRLQGLDEIGLCTSTRWSPGTWQLLLMFHLDRVNRLPEQTQRRVYGCAAPAQRRGGGSVKIFHRGVSPSKKFEHSYYVYRTRSVIRIDKQSSLRRTPSLLRILHTPHSNHIYTQTIRALSVAEAPYFNITWQPGYLVIGTSHPY